LLRGLRAGARDVLALPQELEEGDRRVELARRQRPDQLGELLALRLHDGRARSAAGAPLLLALPLRATLLPRPHAPLAALDRRDAMRVQPRLHARAQALRSEDEPALAVHRVGHQHVLEAAERALSVDRAHELVVQLRILDRGDEALHPAVL